MIATTVESQLRDFARRLIEQSGGIVDWPAINRRVRPWCPGRRGPLPGSDGGVVPAGHVGTRPRTFPGLGGEFLDAAARTLTAFVPARARSRCPTCRSRSRSSSGPWIKPSAGKTRGARYSKARQPDRVPHVVVPRHAAVRGRLGVAAGSDGQLRRADLLPLGNLLDVMDLKPTSGLSRRRTRRSAIAATHAEECALREAQPFLDRMEKRLERDRQRLREYYRALLRETSTPNRRLKTVPSPEEIAARQRAVKLELQRKLAELEERFAFDGLLRPVALAEFHIPGLAIDVRIQRKAATRTFRLFWNGVQKRLEPLRCSCCGKGDYNLWFTNEDVAPICTTCHGG